MFQNPSRTVKRSPGHRGSSADPRRPVRDADACGRTIRCRIETRRRRQANRLQAAAFGGMVSSDKTISGNVDRGRICPRGRRCRPPALFPKEQAASAASCIRANDHVTTASRGNAIVFLSGGRD
jgi:hypothetical protein